MLLKCAVRITMLDMYLTVLLFAAAPVLTLRTVESFDH